MGRKIFTKIGLKHALTQGSIISGCISADYPDKEVYGLIITPRCDLSHGIKVSTVHYLPIVKIDDWKDCDGKRIFIEDAKKQIKSTINNWVVNEYNVYNFLDLPLYSIQKLRDMLNEKKANEKIKKAINDNRFIIASIDHIGGLEFDAVALAGVDGARVPPTTKYSGSHIINFAWFNRLYVAVTRAKYAVAMIGESANEISPLLKDSIDDGTIVMHHP